MERQQTCPWCETDIIWDEELGPEKYCPHCDNEISGYRTLELDAAIDDSKEEDEVDDADSWLAEHEKDDWLEDNGGILRSKRELAANSVIQELTESQFELPECANCREYMIEAGIQTIGAQNDFTPRKISSTNEALLASPFKVIWYVCPSCYGMTSHLSLEDRKAMLDQLTANENL